MRNYNENAICSFTLFKASLTEVTYSLKKKTTNNKNNKITPQMPVWKFWLQTANQLDRDCHHYTSYLCHKLFDNIQTQKSSKECLFNTDTGYAHFQGNPRYQATKQHLNNT